MMFSKLRPLGDRVLIERTKDEEKTSGGIFIPDAAKENGQTGKVISVGTGIVDASGKITPLHVKVGDVVYFGKHSGTKIDRELLLIREDEILGVMET